MNKEEIKIITLGDIFKNIETEEKAFKFKDYIKDLQQENQQLKKQKDDVVEYIKEHTHNVYASGYRNPKTGMLEELEKTPIVNRILQANPTDLLRMLGEIDE